MNQPNRPKYFLLRDNKNIHKSLKSLNNRTTYIRPNMSSTDLNHTQVFDFKKIEECKLIIQSIVERITIQNKKNYLLKNLVRLMNHQMVSITQEEKRSQRQQLFQQSKIIKKLSYDIDKILQKNNQEIANLFRLKDQINAKRSQRVVFSNLFRKIQTELKNAMNIYIQTILKSQTTKDQTLNLKLKSDLSQKSLIIDEDFYNKESEQPSEQREQKSVNIKESQIQNYNENTNYKKRKFKPQKLGASRFITQYSENFEHSEQIQKRMAFTNNQIYQIEFQIRKILQVTGCQDIQELQMFFQKVETQNQLLQKDLEEITKHTEQIQRQKSKIINQRKNAEITDQCGISKSKMKLKNLKSVDRNSDKEEIIQPIHNDYQMIQNLLHIFHLQNDSSDRFHENVKLMDQKLDQLLKFIPNLSNYAEKQEMLQKQTYSSTSGSQKHSFPPLNLILQKTQPIGDSQKLYQKSWFLDAYQRQLKKFNKKQNKKK